MKYSNIIKAFTGSIWNIMPEKLEAILEFVQIKAAGLDISEESRAEIKAASRTRSASRNSSIAVIPILGTMSQRVGLLSEASGGVSTDNIGREFDNAIANPDVGGVLFDVDSPGGSVAGLPELSDKIFRARGRKPILAISNSQMASAALFVGSAADQVWVTPSGEAGSVGTVAVHTDISAVNESEGVKHTIIKAGKHKFEGNSMEPLSEESHSFIQGQVDKHFDIFVTHLARNRGVTKDTVRSDFGEGRMMMAKDAVKAGIADQVGTFDEAVGHISKLIQDKNWKAGKRNKLAGIK